MMNVIQKARIARARREVRTVVRANGGPEHLYDTRVLEFAPSVACPSGRITFGELVERRLAKTAMG